MERIHIVPMKTVKSVKEELKDYKLKDSIMIGNSLRSDIYPALELGMKAIHIERNTWSYDEYEVNKESEDYFTNSLKNVPTLIKKITKNRQ